MIRFTARCILRQVASLMVVALMAGALMAASPNPALAASEEAVKMSSARLYESPNDYDGAVVELTGEAVGERMVRGPFAWVHLNDDGYAVRDSRQSGKLTGFNSGIPLWVPTTLSEDIGVFGDHTHHGTTVQVVGEFHAACVAHGGDTDVHVTALYVVREGADVNDPVGPFEIIVVVVLGLLAAGAAVLERSVRLQRY